MIFSNPRIKEIMIDFYRYSDAEYNTMAAEYYSFIDKLILDESMLFIEQRNLPEYFELQTMLGDNKVNRGDLEFEVQLIQYVASLPTKYPELVKILQTKILATNEVLFEDFIKGLDEPTAIKFLEIMKSELNSLESLVKRANSQSNPT